MKGTAMKAIARVVVPLLLVAFVFGAAYAQFAKPEEAIAYRKAVMTLIAQNIKWMGAVVQGKAAYNKDQFSADADAVEMLATLPWKAMTEPGSDKGDTTLSSAVFDKEEQFMEHATGFEAATAKLATAARGGDLNAVKAQFGQAVKFCKGCHSEFRKK
jgi:cytochrome c556